MLMGFACSDSAYLLNFHYFQCIHVEYLTVYFVISQSELSDRDWSNARHVMCKNKQCCLVINVASCPGNIASRDPCSWGTWCKPRDTMHLLRFFWSDYLSIWQINMFSIVVTFIS